MPGRREGLCFGFEKSPVFLVFQNLAAFGLVFGCFGATESKSEPDRELNPARTEAAPKNCRGANRSTNAAKQIHPAQVCPYPLITFGAVVHFLKKNQEKNITCCTCFIVFGGLRCWEVLKTNGSGRGPIRPKFKNL